MFFFNTTRSNRNALGYLIWSWIYAKNGKLLAELDASFPDLTRLNNYEALAANYTGSNVKPDKQHSILPTVLQMVGDCSGKIVTDIGCGAGFFTVPLAELGAMHVYGLDNSPAQIELANKFALHPRVNYWVRNVFVDPLLESDVMVVPFVMNYARTIPILHHFFSQLYRYTREGGKVVFVVDLPNGRSLERFGATKTFLGPAQDETTIQIDLFNAGKSICTLHAVYYTRQTIEQLLRIVGFKNICWHIPIVSEGGVVTMESEFWKGYTDDPELGYLTAEK